MIYEHEAELTTRQMPNKNSSEEINAFSSLQYCKGTQKILHLICQNKQLFENSGFGTVICT